MVYVRWLCLALILGGLLSAAAACPFCPPTSATLSEQVARADAVALAQWVRSTGKKEQEAALDRTTFEVVSLIKNSGDTLKLHHEIVIPETVSGQVGDLFLLLGTTEEREAANLTWDAPRPISEIGYQYLKQAPAPETAKDKRLRYFLRFLEYPDPLLADDAYAEFAKADYSDLVLVKDTLPKTRIRQWLTDSDTLAPRLGLYGLMLGLCGDASDAELLKAKILDDADETRLGIDGIMAGYLLLTGPKGMELLEVSKLKNPKAPIADVHAAMAALRFLWQYGQGVVPNSRLQQAMRLLLDRSEVADLAIADLARWKDWSIQDRLMELYRRGDPGNPLGEIAVRRAIVRYLIASTLDDSQSNAESPPHVITGRKHLETLRRLDPQTVENFERLMRPR